MTEKKLPISAHVLTFNSGKTLRRALESIPFCAEILVLDGGSTDDTLTIAQECGATVIPQNDDGAGGPVTDFSAVRNRGLKHATQPWILTLDSDEWLSPELQEELRTLMERHPEPAAYLLPRRYILADGRIVMQATTYPNERYYFFHRDAVERWIKPVHERPALKDGIRTGRLCGACLAPVGTTAEFQEKVRRYIRMEAESSKGKGWRHWWRHRLLHTLRSRCIACLRLCRIWMVPGGGTRLPLRHEWVRLWYAWRIIADTCPLRTGWAYFQILPYAQKRFSVLSAFRTALPTAQYFLRIPYLSENNRPLLCTSTIFPPNAVVWHHFARKYLGDAAQLFIFDCGGTLDPSSVPKANVQPMMNFIHSTKIDVLLRIMARTRKIVWVCDDDMYPVSDRGPAVIRESFRDPRTATVSFRPRHWWHFEIDGKQYEPTGSYCFALNRDIVVKKEHLSFRAADGNTHPSHITQKPVGRFDTGDYANEVLLKKGYNCVILPQGVRDECVAGFAGVSGAALLLSYFKKPEQVIGFYLDPPLQQWRGTVLFGTFQSMLSLRAVLELYEKITGKTYAVPSLPSDDDLKRIRAIAEKHIRSDQSFDQVDAVRERLLGLV